VRGDEASAAAWAGPLSSVGGSVRRLVGVVATGCLLSFAAVPLAVPASASVPVLLRTVAGGGYGDGGPALDAKVNAADVARTGDGALVVYDGRAHELRRVDPVTSAITALAGTGSEPTYRQSCYPDTTSAATTVPMFPVHALWGAANGDVYVQSDGYGLCRGSDQLYRLDAGTGVFSLAVGNSFRANSVASSVYSQFAVAPDGTKYAFDSEHAVIRAWAAGVGPGGPSAIVAGTLDSAGDAGDGGPATAARVDGGTMAAAVDGSLYVQGVNKVRRISPSGLISTVAGTGQAPTADPTTDDGVIASSARLAVSRLAVSPDGATVFAAGPYGGQLAVRAFAPGGTVRTVVSPASLSGRPYGCEGLRMAPYASSLAVACSQDLRAWPADGSDRTGPGTATAGIADAVNGQSPDGTPLSRAFFSSIRSLAQSPTGRIAFSADRVVRTVTGLGSTDTLGTALGGGSPADGVGDGGPAGAAMVEPNDLAFGPDGALYVADGFAGSNRSPRIRRVAGNGAISTVVGGGGAMPTPGAQGTSVSLTVVPALAVDASRGLLYFTQPDRAQVWCYALGDHTLSLVAGNGTAGPPTDGSGATATRLSAPSGVAVDPTDGGVVVTQDLTPDYGGWVVGRVSGGVYRALGDLPTDSAGRIRAGSDGTVYTTVSDGVRALAPDGTTAFVVGNGTTTGNGVPAIGALARPVGLTVLAGGGLLYGDGIADPVLRRTDPGSPLAYTGPVATMTAAAGEGRVTLTVTPPGQAGLTVSIAGTDQPVVPLYGSDGTALTSFVTDGTTTPRVYTLSRLGMSPASPVLVPGATYRFAVVTRSAGSDATTSAPSSVAVTPTADVTPPQRPTGLSVRNISPDTMLLGLTLPADQDLDRVELRYAEGLTPPASVTSGRFGGHWGTPTGDAPGAAVTGQVAFGAAPLDAARPYAFSAFALDVAGNVSAAATVVRPAALSSTTSPSPVTDLNWAYDAAGPRTTFRWRGDAFVAWAVPGAVPPATPPPGYAGVNSGSTFYLDTPEVGAPYSVSVFRWNADYTRYSRTSATFTAGTSSADAVALSAPGVVPYGSKPVLTATVTRVVTGTPATAVAGVPTQLWAKVNGAATYQQVATGTTDASGHARWTRPAATAGTTYQVRVPAQGYVYPQIATSTARLVAVQPRLTASLSATRTLTTVTVRHGVTVRLTVRVIPAKVTTLRLQRYTGGAWHTLSSPRTDRYGHLTASYRPASRGTFRLRLVDPATTTTLAATSATLTIKAT
jgi:hypothetical protein